MEKVKLLVVHWAFPMPQFKGISVNSIFQNWQEVASCHPHCPCIPSRWCPPPPGALKLNFDGSTLGNPGMAGAEGLATAMMELSSSPTLVQLGYALSIRLNC